MSEQELKRIHNKISIIFSGIDIAKSKGAKIDFIRLFAPEDHFKILIHFSNGKSEYSDTIYFDVTNGEYDLDKAFQEIFEKHEVIYG